MYEPQLTETQQQAVERHRAFREKIAARAVPDRPIALPRASQGVLGATDTPRKALELLKPAPGSPKRRRSRAVITENLLPAEPSKEVSYDRIKQAVASYYKIRVFDLEAPIRLSCFSTQRYVAIYLIRELCHLSLAEIGWLFNRSSVTMLYSLRQLKKLIETDPKLVADIRKLYWLIIEDGEPSRPASVLP